MHDEQPDNIVRSSVACWHIGGNRADEYTSRVFNSTFDVLESAIAFHFEWSFKHKRGEGLVLKKKLFDTVVLCFLQKVPYDALLIVLSSLYFRTARDTCSLPFLLHVTAGLLIMAREGTWCYCETFSCWQHWSELVMRVSRIEQVIRMQKVWLLWVGASAYCFCMIGIRRNWK